MAKRSIHIFSEPGRDFWRQEKAQLKISVNQIEANGFQPKIANTWNTIPNEPDKVLYDTELQKHYLQINRQCLGCQYVAYHY